MSRDDLERIDPTLNRLSRRQALRRLGLIGAAAAAGPDDARLSGPWAPRYRVNDNSTGGRDVSQVSPDSSRVSAALRDRLSALGLDLEAVELTPAGKREIREPVERAAEKVKAQASGAEKKGSPSTRRRG